MARKRASGLNNRHFSGNCDLTVYKQANIKPSLTWLWIWLWNLSVGSFFFGISHEISDQCEYRYMAQWLEITKWSSGSTWWPRARLPIRRKLSRSCRWNNLEPHSTTSDCHNWLKLLLLVIDPQSPTWDEGHDYPWPPTLWEARI